MGETEPEVGCKRCCGSQMGVIGGIMVVMTDVIVGTAVVRIGMIVVVIGDS